MALSPNPVTISLSSPEAPMVCSGAGGATPWTVEWVQLFGIKLDRKIWSFLHADPASQEGVLRIDADLTKPAFRLWSMLVGSLGITLQLGVQCNGTPEPDPLQVILTP